VGWWAKDVPKVLPGVNGKSAEECTSTQNNRKRRQQVPAVNLPSPSSNLEQKEKMMRNAYLPRVVVVAVEVGVGTLLPLVL
jgi:hypothetical protein